MPFSIDVAARISLALDGLRLDGNVRTAAGAPFETECVRVFARDRRRSTSAAITFVVYGRHSWIALPRISGAFDRELLATLVYLFCDEAARADPSARVVAAIPLTRSAVYGASLLKRSEGVRYGCFLNLPQFVRPRGVSESRSLGVTGGGADPLWDALQDTDKRRTWAFSAHGFRAVAKRRTLQTRICEPLLDVVWCFSGDALNLECSARALEIGWRWNHRVTGVFAMDAHSARAPTHAVALL